MIYEINDFTRVNELFAGWEETLIYSCLQKVMGKIFVTDTETAESAMAYVGCFGFLAGLPDKELLMGKPDGFSILVPQNEEWSAMIEECFPDSQRVTRYAIKKDTVFDTEYLDSLITDFQNDPKFAGYELKAIDGEIYDLCLPDPLTRDFVSSFENKESYLELGRGMVIMKDGRIVAGASSFTRYKEGIEIEVDTAPEERRKGLATICAAALILKCLKEGLYPSWDAANLGSVHLAEKLGYEFDHEYAAYEVDMPESIRKYIDHKTYHVDDVGCSESQVRIYDDLVLKIEKDRKELDDMVTLMKWLEGKLPVPKVICTEKRRGYRYLLMSKAEGLMACDPYYMEKPEVLVPLLAETIRMLWSVDISDCPRKCTLETVLKEARYRVEQGMVDVDDAEPDTYGEGGFKDPEELLSWLEANRPEEEPVFSHGDLCLPNIFINDGKISCLIDLGNAGISDKWQDLALCYRSLKHNADGSYGKVYPGIHEDDLFKLLGIEPDPEKLRYYILLDELF